MYERIIGTGRLVRVNKGTGGLRDVEQFEIYDAAMREVLHTATGMEDAKLWLECELKRERLACPTGGCED